MKNASISMFIIAIFIILGKAEAQEGRSYPSEQEGILRQLEEELKKPSVPMITTPTCDCYSKPGDYIPKITKEGCVVEGCNTRAPGGCRETHYMRAAAALDGVVNPQFGVRQQAVIPSFWCQADFWRDIWQSGTFEGASGSSGR